MVESVYCLYFYRSYYLGKQLFCSIKREDEFILRSDFSYYDSINISSFKQIYGLSKANCLDQLQGVLPLVSDPQPLKRY